MKRKEGHGRRTSWNKDREKKESREKKLHKVEKPSDIRKKECPRGVHKTTTKREKGERK